MRTLAALMRTLAPLMLLVFPASGQKKADPVEIAGVEKEVALGRQLAAESVSQNKPLADPEKSACADRIVQMLAARAALPFPVSITLVDAPRPIAEAWPGGFLTAGGRLFGETNESELAAVFAHLIAHIAERRARPYTVRGGQNTGFTTAPLIFIGGSLCARFGRQVALPIVSHQDAIESEGKADKLAAEYLTRAGFEIPPMPALFERLSRIPPRRPESWKRPTLRRPVGRVP